jgi:hypothetical protein
MNNQLIKRQPINKIVVVGHPLSGYGAVEALLNSCGVSPALASRRDGFLPTEISATLCKAHRIPPFHALAPDAEIAQLGTGPIWHGLALDLLLGNIDQELWGWADPQAVYLLDYWKELDPQLAFILVYDTPEQLVAQAFDEQTPLSPEALQQVAQNWSAYNAALLHFYHRNPERCLLVHAQQVRASASTYLQQVRTRIGAPVMADHPDTKTHSDSDIELAQQRGAAAPQDALKDYIARALIQQQPDSLQLYEELQSVANLPLADHEAAPTAPLDAWLSMVALQSRYTKQATKAQTHERAQEAQIQALSQSLRGAKALAGERQQQIARLEQAQATAEQRSQEQQQENEMILLQLHQVQEELERHYLDGQQQQVKIKALQEAEKLAGKRTKDLEQLIQDKAKLATERASQLELSQKAKAETDKALANTNAELSKAQASAKAQSDQLIRDNAKLAAERDSQAKLAKERASQIEQINKQLATQTQLAQSQAAQIKETAAKPAVVNTELAQENDLLLLQLHQVQEELERYYLENQQLKQEGVAPGQAPKPMQYGAADRVKRDLAYRLGGTMIAQSRSFRGWVSMPTALLKQRREFKREQKAQGDKVLPPIEDYADASEADRVMQHLSYRLGAAMVAHARSPLGWLKMPWALRRAIRDYRRARGTK